VEGNPVIQHVREKFTCRDCEKISQAPAPFHVLAPGLGRPQPVGDDPVREVRAASAAQSSGRTLHPGGRTAQPVDPSRPGGRLLCGAGTAPQLLRRIEAHVFAAERLHGDDTTVPVLAKGKTDTRRCWVYGFTCATIVRSAGSPPAAMFYYSRDRGGEHAQAHMADYTGIFQADAFGGYNKLYEADRKPGPILEAACWAHARRPFFIMADVAANARRTAQGKTPGVISPLALEAVRRIDAPFEIERSINGQSADRRRAVRQELSAPLIADLLAARAAAQAVACNDLAKAMDYMLKRWPAFTRFLDDGRICLSNNAAERALRGIAMWRSLCRSSSSLETLEAGSPAHCDRDDLFAQSRQPPVPVAGRRHGFGRERPAQPARRGECRL
jgi:transposase